MNIRPSPLVVRVIDGDTMVLENNERVQYIGIDTPELSSGRKVEEALAIEAKAYNKELVEGKRVKLEIDLRYQEKFKAAEGEARWMGRGLWGSKGGAP